jgi:hypothetical protein
MKTIVISLFVACVIGSSMAQDCSAKIEEFHTCQQAGHKKDQADGKAKFEAIKAKIDACYTDNGCTAPVKGQKGKGGSSGSSAGASGEKRHGNHTGGSECGKALRDAMKQSFETCVKQAGVTLPQKDGQKDGGHHEGGHRKGGFNHKDDNKALTGCAKAQAVRDCKRALMNSTRPSQDEMKARFQAGCAAKQTCLTALGADCQTQMEKNKKAICLCRQQQHQQADQIRSSVAACKDVQSKKPENGKGKDSKVRSCDDERKDYCKLGFDVMVQDFKGKNGAHH